MLPGLGWANEQAKNVSEDKASLTKVNDAAVLAQDQLEINKEALLRGSTKAALLLLNNEDPASRAVLLDLLTKADNKDAVTAICNVLVQAKEGGIDQIDDFKQPLLALLQQKDTEFGKLAAETTLLFDYDDIGSDLEALAKNEDIDTQARLNAIHALQFHPEKQAVIVLLDLVDAKDPAVAEGAKAILKVLGIPIGNSLIERQKNRALLQRKSKDAFLRDYILEQEKRIQRAKTESDTWRSLYLDSLDQLYATITDDTVRGEFLVQQMRAPQNQRRRWALQKAGEWRRAAGTRLPTQMSPVLQTLIADEDRSVRLATAQLLSKMGEVSSAQGLLKQLEVEQDREVRIALFVALGMACDYALLLEGELGAPVSTEVKRRTLELAGSFLQDPDPNYVREGADVIRKLLEKNGLSGEEETTYLTLLRDRFQAEDMAQNLAGRADLLHSMAGLCLTRSACKDKAIALYKPLFIEYQGDRHDRIRQNAIEGIFNVDELAALRQLRKNAPNDSNPAIRQRLIEAALHVGGVEDLDWLVSRLAQGQGQEGVLAWQAIATIVTKLDVPVAVAWLKRTTQNKNLPYSNEQLINLLQSVERKAVGNEHLESRTWLLEQLVHFYRQSEKLEDAVKALQLLIPLGPKQDRADREAELVDIQLKLGQLDPIINYLNRRLSKRDIPPSDPVFKTLERYCQNQGEAEVANIRHIVKNTKTNEARENWTRFAAKWQGGEKKAPVESTPKPQ